MRATQSLMLKKEMDSQYPHALGIISHFAAAHRTRLKCKSLTKRILQRPSLPRTLKCEVVAVIEFNCIIVILQFNQPHRWHILIWQLLVRVLALNGGFVELPPAALLHEAPSEDTAA